MTRRKRLSRESASMNFRSRNGRLARRSAWGSWRRSSTCAWPITPTTAVWRRATAVSSDAAPSPTCLEAVLPFAWVLREAMETLGEEHALDVQAEREPSLGFKTQGIQEHFNHTGLLGTPPAARC